MNETNRCTVNFQFFINGTIALHVSGSFSAHHQERYQPYVVSTSAHEKECVQDDNWLFYPRLQGAISQWIKQP